MDNTKKPEPAGLGGWLVLVAIGITVSFFRLTTFLWTTYVPIFRDGAWEVLTTPGTEVYHPLWAPMLIMEIVVNLGFVVAQLWLLALFFGRARFFPKLYIGVALVNLGFIVLDAWLGTFLITNEPMFDDDTAKELIRSIISVSIWVPYMLLSVRVKNTFIDRPAFAE